MIVISVRNPVDAVNINFRFNLQRIRLYYFVIVNFFVFYLGVSVPTNVSNVLADIGSLSSMVCDSISEINVTSKKLVQP